MASRSFILIPLYIYPTTTSWQPLLSAAVAQPELSFKVVVNPANGPGKEALPDANYLAGLRALARLSNVQILGYIHCSWGQRERTELEADVLVYAGWADKALTNGGACHDAIRIDGIFIDESPANSGLVGYMAATTRFIRKTFAKPIMIIYNPGLVVHSAFYQAADYVVVFENRADQWSSDYVQSTLGTLTPELRRKSIAIAHSCASHKQQLELGRRLFQEYGMLGQLVTTEAGYTTWDPYWEGYWQGLESWGQQQQQLEDGVSDN